MSVTLPTGTVTFLFSDIAGSTRLLQELGHAYADVLMEHRRLLREAWQRNGGMELGTEGDSFFVVFERATDALKAAIDAQGFLRDGRVRVRIGLHTGEPLVVDGDYIGIDVHLAARIAGAAHGGQVLLSERTRSLAESAAGAVRDLGEHLLKDFDVPVRLFQVGEGSFPTLRTRSVSNLPTWDSPILGRQRDIEGIVAAVQNKRFVVVTGPGGIGKSRLAAAVAAEASPHFAYGAVWVSLSSVDDASLVLPTIESTLGTQSVTDHVGDRHMLIVIDNMEQVVSAVDDLKRVLDECRSLHVLVTSRAPLRVRDEYEVRIEPLDDAAAAALFRRDAHDDGDDEVITEICRRLDRLPLAIELAAARTRIFSTRQLLEKLDQALAVLTDRRRDVPERQRTLYGAIAWSYDLLPPALREIFARLSVFRGSFDIEAAQAVCAASLDDLEELLEQSLLHRSAERLAMLLTVREFATTRLGDSGELDRVLDNHARYFAGLAERSGEHMAHENAGEWIRRLTADRDNVQAALHRLFDRGLALEAAPACIALQHFWAATGRIHEAAQTVEAALKEPWHDDTSRAQLLRNWAWFLAMLDRPREEVQSVLAEAVRHARASGDPRITARALCAAFAPQEDIEEALRLSIEVGETDMQRLALHFLGERRRDAGDFDAAEKLLRDAVEISKQQKTLIAGVNSLHSLGDLELDRGNFDSAHDYYVQCLRVAVDHALERPKIYCVAGLAAVALKRGDRNMAAILWRAAEQAERDLKFRMFAGERRRYEAVLDPLDTTSAPLLSIDEASSLAL